MSAGNADTAAPKDGGMNRLPALDGLRGIAALMVFVHHAQLPGLHPALIGMDAGVLMFFSLSGYLLYAPFVNGPVDLRRYAVRRLARILPAYLVAAVGIAVLFYPESLGDPIGILTMTHTPIVVAWTLQIEITFYALLPLLARFVSGTNRLLTMATASIAIGIEVMAVSIRTIGYAPSTALGTFATFAWAFVPGMLVAELRPRVGWWALPAGVGLIAVSVVVDLPSYLDLAAGLGSGLIVAFTVTRSIPRWLVRPALAAGAVSYSLYLWHEQIVVTVDRPATWIGAALALCLSLAIASVVYVLVERPAMRAASRFGRGRPSVPYVSVARTHVGHLDLAALPATEHGHRIAVGAADHAGEDLGDIGIAERLRIW